MRSGLFLLVSLWTVVAGDGNGFSIKNCIGFPGGQFRFYNDTCGCSKGLKALSNLAYIVRFACVDIHRRVEQEVLLRHAGADSEARKFLKAPPLPVYTSDLSIMERIYCSCPKLDETPLVFFCLSRYDRKFIMEYVLPNPLFSMYFDQLYGPFKMNRPRYTCPQRFSRFCKKSSNTTHAFCTATAGEIANLWRRD